MATKTMFSLSLLLTLICFYSLETSALCINDTIDVRRNSWRDKGHQAVQKRLKKNSRPKKITIHYTGTDLKKIKRRPVTSTLRGLYNYSVNTKKWGDVPYHYFIDRDGASAEARDPQYQADTNTNYNPNGHVTIVIQGGPNDKLSNKQKNKLFRMIKGLQNKYDIQTSNVGVHKDHASTLCPGDHISGLVKEYKKMNASYRPRPEECGKKAEAPLSPTVTEPATTSS